MTAGQDSTSGTNESVRDRAARLALQLALDTLAERTGRTVQASGLTPVENFDVWTARGSIDDKSLALAVAFIVPPAGEAPWYTAKAALEGRIGARLPGAYILWAPGGADLPAREPLSSDAVMRIEELASRLVPGGHGEVRFPVELLLRKSDDEGTYITARGGLAFAWAQFTNRVFGHYQLDSSELNRLPAGEGYLRSLVDQIVAIANTLQLGQSARIETEDAWTLQRLREGSGFTIVGEPPGDAVSSGTPLRRNLRRVVQALRGPLLDQPADARAILFIGPYGGFEGQPVGAALLGFDPSLYAGLDMVLLAADGEARPILDLTRNALLKATESTL